LNNTNLKLFFFIDSDNEDIVELMDLDVFDDEVEEEGVIDEEEEHDDFEGDNDGILYEL